MKEKFSKYMNVSQYASYVGVSEKTVWDWIKKGKIIRVELPLPNGKYHMYIDTNKYPSGPKDGVKWNMVRSQEKNLK